MRTRSLTSAILGLALALAAVVVWQVLDYQAQVRAHEAEHRRHGFAVLNAFESVAIRECRGGQYRPEDLDAALAETREKFSLAWLALRDGQGRTLSESGQAEDSTGPLHLFRKPFQPPRPRRGGFGRGFGSGRKTTALPESGLEILIRTDPGELDAKLAEDFRRNLITTLSLSVALLLFALLYWHRIRSLELRSQLLASEEKLRSLDYLRRLGAGLVHETKNPLSVVRGFTERILHKPLEGEDLTQTARAILDETDRTVSRLDEFLLLSRPAKLKRSPFAVDALLGELGLLLGPDIHNRSAHLDIRCSGQILDADREQIRRLFMNLLLNAVAAIPEGGHIRIDCESNGDLTRIMVTDDGFGVAPELRDTLFEPYVTGREGGTGLGLSIAHRIALDHGFTLRYEPNSPTGTRLILEAPRP